MAQTVQEIRTDFNGTTGGSSSALTTAASGSAFIILVSCDQSVTITINNDSKGNSYTAAAAGLTISGNNQVKAYYATSASPTGGASHTASVTFSGNAFGSIYFIEVTNSTSGAIDAYNTASYNPGAGPYPVTSGTPAQSDYTVLSICGATGGGTNTFSATGYTLDSQGDGTTYWPSGIGSKIVTGVGTAQTCAWGVVGTSDALDIILLVKASAGGGGGTYTPPGNVPQIFASQPSSFAPMMRFASVAATALAVTAGAYVPVGARAAQQSQATYRELPFYAQQEQQRLNPEKFNGITVASVPCSVPQQPTTTPWPYGLARPAINAPIAQPAAQIGASAPFVPSAVGWAYVGIARPPASFSQGITVQSVPFVPIVQLPAGSWSYQSAFSDQSPIAALIPAAATTIFARPPTVPRAADWGYAGIAALEAPIPLSQGIVPPYALSPVLTPVREPEWPYAATMLPAPSASRFSVTLQLPWLATLLPVRQPEWPYAATLVPGGTASRFGGAAAYYGLVTTKQWLSIPPWPYSVAMPPKPTASMFGVAPPPPPVNTGQNGLRRWAIQQYEAYFSRRDLEDAKKADAKREAAKPKLPRKIHWRKPDAQDLQLDLELQAAMRLAQQVSAGAIDLDVRLTTLEQQQALALPPLPNTSIPAPSGQQAVDQADEDLLLLAILFGDEIWQKNNPA